MGSINIELLILQFILIIICLFVIIKITNFVHAAQLEKRIGKYGIDPLNSNYQSIFDKLHIKYKIIVKDISHILNNSHVIKKISKKYDKYISYEENDESIDYVSKKILFIVFLTVITLLSNIIRFRTFTFAQLFTILIVGFFAPDIILMIREKLRKKQIDDDILEAIIIMNNAFKSGRTTMQAIEIVKNELSGPVGEEFKKMYIDISFGLSLDVAFERFAKRINNDDINFITASLTILNKTGGDIVKVFSSIERSFFSRRKIKNELKTLTSSSNLMFKFLITVPFIIFLIIFFLNPTYFNPLFTTKVGLILFGIIILIFILYVYFVKKTMKIKV